MALSMAIHKFEIDFASPVQSMLHTDTRRRLSKRKCFQKKKQKKNWIKASSTVSDITSKVPNIISKQRRQCRKDKTNFERNLIIDHTVSRAYTAHNAMKDRRPKQRREKKKKKRPSTLLVSHLSTPSSSAQNNIHSHAQTRSSCIRPSEQASPFRSQKCIASGHSSKTERKCLVGARLSYPTFSFQIIMIRRRRRSDNQFRQNEFALAFWCFCWLNEVNEGNTDDDSSLSALHRMWLENWQSHAIVTVICANKWQFQRPTFQYDYVCAFIRSDDERKYTTHGDTERSADAASDEHDHVSAIIIWQFERRNSTPTPIKFYATIQDSDRMHCHINSTASRYIHSVQRQQKQKQTEKNVPIKVAPIAIINFLSEWI